ncbi:hypothetical protein HJC23_000011 [Cyclotella cryptica]|uniref:Farnesoic acid O-methyl transferase domain-containing protein n=1 Tax=Cyclotella cryptica TaxID=29204 RepID=A0ABD3PCC0_9STRA|eukprot:CCRYP_016251-RA/>CCRYP_016251-RA protein AED:0.18 eAED:0.18 QI:180/-1/1/1/-1/1/1/351/445
MKHSNMPRYHPIDNPPYQINYRAKRSGKHITCTKRRVTFQFGFSNRDAIASGLTEGDCRGEEHEVVLIWSHVSGKRQIFMDGREIHMSKGPMGNTKFSHSWGIGNHVLKIVANATPPTAEQARMNDGARQFDLFLDGMSYFKFCQIYQLGTGSQLGTGRPSREAERFGRDKSISIASSTLSTSMNSDDVHEDDDDNISPPPVSELQLDVFEAPSVSSDLLELDLPSPSYSTFGHHGQPPSLASTFSSSYDEFSPVNASCDGFKKSFASISNEILTAYSGNDVSKTLSPPQHNTAAQDPASGSLALVTTNLPTSYSVGEKPAEPQKFVSMYDRVDQEQDVVDDITRCMRNLVNLDDVSKPSPMLSKSSTSTRQQDKSQSLQSLQWAISGRSPTLSEIHSMKSTSNPSSTIMNNPQFLMASTSIVPNQGTQHYGYYGPAPGAYERAY